MHSRIFALNLITDTQFDEYDESQVGNDYADYTTDLPEGSTEFKESFDWLTDTLSRAYGAKVGFDSENRTLTFNCDAVAKKFYENTKERLTDVIAKFDINSKAQVLDDLLTKISFICSDPYGFHFVVKGSDFTLEQFIRSLYLYGKATLTFKVVQIFNYHC